MSDGARKHAMNEGARKHAMSEGARKHAMTGWLLGGETVEVDCDVDIEQTPLSFHAHAVPDGIDIRPGDAVQVHGIPADIDFGDALTCRCRATVTRAGALARLWTEFTAMFELTELYEVGFMPKET